MPNINIDDAYILNETGAQVDKVTGLYFKDESTSAAEKAFAQLNIGTAGSNRNLLDNPFFQVNQRSFTTSTGNTYTVDRWIKSGNATVTLSNGIIVFDASSATSSHNFFSQRLAQDLTGRTVTLSLMTDDGTIYSKSVEIPARTSSAQTAISLTISTGVFLEFTVSASSAAYTASIDVVLRNGRGPLNIKAVKLELGSVSTLANDAPPDYWQELDKCLYFFERITNNGSSPITIGAGFADGVNNLYAPVHIHRKRAGIATISTSGAIYAGQRSSNISVSSVTQYNSSPDGIITLLAVTPSSFTSNEYYRLALGAGAHIDFSADL